MQKKCAIDETECNEISEEKEGIGEREKRED